MSKKCKKAAVGLSFSVCARAVPQTPAAVQEKSVNRNDECTENGKLSAQKTVTTVHKNQ